MSGAPAVLVARTFELDGEPVVHCRVFAPEPGKEDFGCAFEIEWPDRTKRYGPIIGIDSVQALDLALKHLCFTLEFSAEYKAGRLRWFGRKTLGLPRTPMRRVRSKK